MRIGGFLPTSLSDFPGRVAAVIFTQGCNFRCPFCHNGNLIPEQRFASDLLREDEILERLSARRRQLDGVVVTGGEPTLQENLPAFLSTLKRFGYAVKLDTNGSRPDVLATLLAESLIDYVAMDVKAPLSDYARLAGVDVAPDLIRMSIGLLSRGGVEHEFRTTAVEPLLNERDMGSIRVLIPAGSRYRVQPFRQEHALAGWLRTHSSILRADSTPPQPRSTHALTVGEADEH